jgi:DNA polymerase III sliding clamp (beta) subunit (PCNA family)
MSTATLERTTTATVALKTAKQIASLVVFTDSKRGHVPALQLIKLSFDRNNITAVATDRYCAAVAQWGYDTVNGDVDGSIYLDAAAAKFITGLVAKPGAVVEFDIAANTIAYQQYSDYQAKHFCDRFSGQFPAVETLFDGLTVGGPSKLALNVSFLAKLGKLVGDDGKKLDQAWEFTYHNELRPNRPAPVIATNSAYKVIIQPNLIKA